MDMVTLSYFSTVRETFNLQETLLASCARHMPGNFMEKQAHLPGSTIWHARVATRLIDHVGKHGRFAGAGVTLSTVLLPRSYSFI